MKNKLLIIFTGLCVSLSAQNYYCLKKVGAAPTGYDIAQVSATSGTTSLLAVASNDLMSTEQTIPFSFNYYGIATTKYKASDNGYLTFNTTATASAAPSLTALPTAGDPNNAIYAFWHDFELKSAPNTAFPVKVFSYTTGASPNRIHHIQWFGVSKKGEAIAANTNVYAFAVSLYEGTAGRFDITYGGYGSSASAGIIGCENSDGTLGKMAGNAVANFKVAADYLTSNYITYQFKYGTQPVLEPAILSVNTAKFYKVATGVTLSALVTNNGSTPITALTFNYTIGTGPTQSNAVTGLNLLGSGESSATISSTIPWTSGAAGSVSDVKVWITNPNTNGVDEDMTNNEKIIVNVLRNNGTSTVQRNVLFEEATGAWCGYCPDGHLILKDAIDEWGDRLIPLVHHNGDAMATTESNLINSAYAGGYPDGFVDRVAFPANRGTWASEISNRMAINAPVEVTITVKNFNPTTRLLSYRINARFSDYWAGDLRIGAIVSESDVRGPNTNQWSQANFFSKSGSAAGGASHPLYNEKVTMEGYIHNHVTRSMPGGAWGVASIIPDVAEPNVDYTYDASYTLPASNRVTYTTTNNTEYCNTNAGPGWNIPGNLHLIGYVSEFDADVTKRPVLNAGSKLLWNFAADINAAANNILVNKVYPNPANQFANVSINLTQKSNVKVIVTNQLGQVVSTEQNGEMEAGENIFFINTSNFASGIYTVTITTDNSSTSTLLNVAR